jgi:hypothetical protein
VAMITKEALAVLVPALGTCGYKASSIHRLALTLSTASEGKLESLVGSDLNAMEDMTIGKLLAELTDGIVTPESVVRRYAIPGHTRDMDIAAKSGMPSTSAEIPEDVRAVAHTALWIRDEVYDNGKVAFSVRGLVPLGDQSGNLIVHLAGSISSRCSYEFLSEINKAQAEDTLFMTQARLIAKRGGLDYRVAPVLTRNTLEAKQELGL